MELNITKETKQPDAARTAYVMTGTLDQKPTPSRVALVEAIAKKLSVDASTIIVSKVATEFGNGNFELHAHVYTSVDDAKRFEPAHYFKRSEKKAEEGA